MKARYVSDYFTEQHRAALGRSQHQAGLALGLTIGAEYLVLGLRLGLRHEYEDIP